MSDIEALLEDDYQENEQRAEQEYGAETVDELLAEDDFYEVGGGGENEEDRGANGDADATANDEPRHPEKAVAMPPPGQRAKPAAYYMNAADMERPDDDEQGGINGHPSTSQPSNHWDRGSRQGGRQGRGGHRGGYGDRAFGRGGRGRPGRGDGMRGGRGGMMPGMPGMGMMPGMPLIPGMPMGMPMPPPEMLLMMQRQMLMEQQQQHQRLMAQQQQQRPPLPGSRGGSTAPPGPGVMPMGQVPNDKGRPGDDLPLQMPSIFATPLGLPLPGAAGMDAGALRVGPGSVPGLSAGAPQDRDLLHAQGADLPPPPHARMAPLEGGMEGAQGPEWQHGSHPLGGRGPGRGHGPGPGRGLGGGWGRGEGRRGRGRGAAAGFEPGRMPYALHQGIMPGGPQQWEGEYEEGGQAVPNPRTWSLQQQQQQDQPQGGPDEPPQQQQGGPGGPSAGRVGGWGRGRGAGGRGGHGLAVSQDSSLGGLLGPRSNKWVRPEAAAAAMASGGGAGGGSSAGVGPAERSPEEMEAERQEKAAELQRKLALIDRKRKEQEEARAAAAAAAAAAATASTKVEATGASTGTGGAGGAAPSASAPAAAAAADLLKKQEEYIAQLKRMIALQEASLKKSGGQGAPPSQPVKSPGVKRAAPAAAEKGGEGKVARVGAAASASAPVARKLRPASEVLVQQAAQGLARGSGEKGGDGSGLQSAASGQGPCGAEFCEEFVGEGSAQPEFYGEGKWDAGYEQAQEGEHYYDEGCEEGGDGEQH